MLNAGLAPGVSNLVIADLLRTHPEADTIEFAMCLSAKGMSGRAGVKFVHENLTTVGRYGVPSRQLTKHTTTKIPLPDPVGPRRCFGFAEREHAWIGNSAGGRRVQTYAYIDKKGLHNGILAVNRLAALSLLPLAPFLAGHGRVPATPTTESVAHWVSVLRDGNRLAARTVQCAGDYLHTAAATAIMADAFLSAIGCRGFSGIFNPEEVFTHGELWGPLELAGITIADPLAVAATVG